MSSWRAAEVCGGEASTHRSGSCGDFHSSAIGAAGQGREASDSKLLVNAVAFQSDVETDDVGSVFSSLPSDNCSDYDSAVSECGEEEGPLAADDVAVTASCVAAGQRSPEESPTLANFMWKGCATGDGQRNSEAAPLKRHCGAKSTRARSAFAPERKAPPKTRPQTRSQARPQGDPDAFKMSLVFLATVASLAEVTQGTGEKKADRARSLQARETPAASRSQPEPCRRGPEARAPSVSRSSRRSQRQQSRRQSSRSADTQALAALKVAKELEQRRAKQHRKEAEQERRLQLLKEKELQAIEEAKAAEAIEEAKAALHEQAIPVAAAAEAIEQAIPVAAAAEASPTGIAAEGGAVDVEASPTGIAAEGGAVDVEADGTWELIGDGCQSLPIDTEGDEHLEEGWNVIV